MTESVPEHFNLQLCKTGSTFESAIFVLGDPRMLTLFVLPLILTFAPVAVWALRVGGCSDCGCCALSRSCSIFLRRLCSQSYIPFLVPGKSFTIPWRSWGRRSCSPLSLYQWRVLPRGRFQCS
jgi:hypothetical protein